MSDSSNSNVSDNSVTSDKQQQPESEKSATEKAVDLLKREMAAGRDFVNKELSRKQATEYAKQVGSKHGVIYAARSKIQKELQDRLTDNAGKSIAAEIDVDDLIEGAKEVTGGQPAGSSGAEGSQQQLITETEKPKKEFVPIDVEAVKTISDAMVEAIADFCKGKGKEIPPAQVKAAKTTYNTTYEAYGATIPKFALIPLCVLVTIVIFGLPMRAEIQHSIAALKDMLTGEDRT